VDQNLFLFCMLNRRNYTPHLVRGNEAMVKSRASSLCGLSVNLSGCLLSLLAGWLVDCE
jgi:hypothetical protein